MRAILSGPAIELLFLEQDAIKASAGEEAERDRLAWTLRLQLGSR